MISKIRENILSWAIILLLLAQVLLSLITAIKINQFETSAARLFGEEGPEIPAFIDEVSIDDDPSIGLVGAPITIVEFSDYQCPFCAEADKNIKHILSDYSGDILFVYRDYPLEQIHPKAFSAAIAANCSGEQGNYWGMHDLLLANQDQLENENITKYAIELRLNLEQFENCLKEKSQYDEIHKDKEDGDMYQVHATPTFFINGYRVEGGDLEQLERMIEYVKKK